MEEDRSASPASSSSRDAAVAPPRRIRGRRRSEEGEEEDDGGDRACAGKKCQSCAAGAIADCVAVCCCPCAVVNFFTLAFVKLPWAVARRCIRRRRRRRSRRRRRRMLEEEKGKWREGDTDGISGSGGAEEGTSEIVLSLDELNDHFGAELKAEDVWLQVYDEVGHLGFGRVSFTGIPFHDKGD